MTEDQPRGDTYVTLTYGDVATTRVIANDVQLDLDLWGNPVGVEVLGAIEVKVDGREVHHDVLAPIVVVGETLTPPARDHDAAEQSRRDDLARDVARMWLQPSHEVAQEDWGPKFQAALHRLAAAYLPDGPKDTPQ